MNFNKLPVYCYLDRTKKMVPYEPEMKVEMETFKESVWRKKFPQDIITNLNLNKLLLTNVGLYSIATPTISKKMVDFILMLSSTFKINIPNKDLRITETNGGLGGFSLRLAQHFDNLNIVEINPQHADIIENNINVYNLDSNTKKIKIYKKDYLSIMYTIESDIIICDPPWGGYSYNKQRSIKLGMCNINIICIINELLHKNLFKIFILMAPRNYDIQDFVNNIKSDNIIIHKLDRHYFIAVMNII